MAVEIPIHGRSNIALSYCISAGYSYHTFTTEGLDPNLFQTVKLNFVA